MEGEAKAQKQEEEWKRLRNWDECVLVKTANREAATKSRKTV